MSTKVDTYRVHGDRLGCRLVEPAAGRLSQGVPDDRVVAGQRPALPTVRLAEVDTYRVHDHRRN
ncbi:hypothetical protein [Stenotrophomonas maltophilia]|uniref:hypothetical protein n=1 Tax=Stenotrophomonas maltophilia TaxID=40324 RepID=UPI0013DA687A|nr:hypothetical protein [Stenotrophomonas maltophilia]